MKQKFKISYEWSMESIESALSRHGINLVLDAPERNRLRLRIRRTNPATEGIGTIAIALVEKGTALPLNWETVDKVTGIIRREAVTAVFE